MITRARAARRTATAVALIASLGLLHVGVAGAESAVERAVQQKQRLVRIAARARADHFGHSVVLNAVISRSDLVFAEGPGRGRIANPTRWLHLKEQLKHDRWAATVRLRTLTAATDRRLRRLARRRSTIQRWLETWGIFRVCPIRGSHQIANNFGITVRLPGVPVHRHTGNDVSAATGTPIVAPFEGYASASQSDLGGMEVRVNGELGSVYNAHLSAYGSLGQVRAGDVIGYVGSTGDATAPHDHLEWHPDDGSAVDPYPYLTLACG